MDGNIMGGGFLFKTRKNTHLGLKKRMQMCTCGHLREDHFNRKRDRYCIKFTNMPTYGLCGCNKFERSFDNLVDELRSTNK